MDIHFRNLIPLPLKDSPRAENSIWKSEFVLKQGEKVCLNAHSGKGKTTFIHILTGIRTDYEGDVIFKSDIARDLSKNAWTSIRKEKISVVFQDLQLFPELTVKENLLLKNELTQTYSEAEIKSMIKRLGIEDKWDSTCKTLSLGQQQRVAIIRSLCQPFNWLIMDEPFSHLDQENAQKALDLINEKVEEHKAGFIITSLDPMHNYNFDKTLNL